MVIYLQIVCVGDYNWKSVKMMYGNYDRHEDRDYDKNFNCIKYMIYTVNIVLLVSY